MLAIYHCTSVSYPIFGLTTANQLAPALHVSTYVCMYLRTYVHMYVCVCTYVCMYVHTYIHMYIHAYVSMHIHIYPYTLSEICKVITIMYLCMYVHMHVCIYNVCVYLHVYMLMCMQTYLLLYKVEKPSVCLSICTLWHADKSAVAVLIENKLLEMKVVSLKITKCNFRSLQN